MSLADVPIASPCIVRTVGQDSADARYRAVGIDRGSVARVLARYPSPRPSFAEVEIDGARLVTLPLAVAGSMLVEPLGEPEAEVPR